jgi:hypothetical protein
LYSFEISKQYILYFCIFKGANISFIKPLSFLLRREIPMNKETGNQNNAPRQFLLVGLGVVIGMGIGVALGTAMNNLGAGIAIGIAFGAGIGTVLNSNAGKNK